jgi:hypothetical protein
MRELAQQLTSASLEDTTIEFHDGAHRGLRGLPLLVEIEDSRFLQMQLLYLRAGESSNAHALIGPEVLSQTGGYKNCVMCARERSLTWDRGFPVFFVT